MGTSLTAEKVLANKGELWHKSEHFDSEEILSGASNLLHWHEENSVQQTRFPGIILDEDSVHRHYHSVLLSRQGDHVHGRGVDAFVGIEEKHLAAER